MPRSGDADDVESGYLAEFDFIREGMRQDQRERHGFLGFALAASGVVLGLLIRSDPALSASRTCFLIGLAALAVLIAERLTIRASQGVASAGAYLRLFVEPRVAGLRYQRRNEAYVRHVRGTVSASLGFGYAYLGLTAAFVAAWWASPISDGRAWWHAAVVLHWPG